MTFGQPGRIITAFLPSARWNSSTN